MDQQTNQQTDIPAWLTDLFANIDRAGVEGIYDRLDEDVAFRFGSFPAGRGRRAFADLWGGMGSIVAALRHELIAAWEVGDTTICRGTVTYDTTDGRSVTLPFANFFRLRDGKIVEYLIYVDASAVFGVPPT